MPRPLNSINPAIEKVLREVIETYGQNLDLMQHYREIARELVFMLDETVYTLDEDGIDIETDAEGRLLLAIPRGHWERVEALINGLAWEDEHFKLFRQSYQGSKTQTEKNGGGTSKVIF